jgi:signal transduction histidine kinase
VLTVLFSRSFFVRIFRNGEIPGSIDFVVFLTVPAVLLLSLAISGFGIIADIVYRRLGSKFKARLLAYFIVIVVFAATPSTVMTGIAINELVVFWNNIDTGSADEAARGFIIDNYSLHGERFENIVNQINFSDLAAGLSRSPDRLPRGIASVQIFTENGESEVARYGAAKFVLGFPPVSGDGYAPRELPRDYGTIRYVRHYDGLVFVLSYDLGDDFDRGKAAIENQSANFEIIDLLKENLKPLIIFYYSVFFLPTLLMTVIIALSFTRRVTRPIAELTEATRRVADGDFSIQILALQNDELGVLIRSFNSMVQELKKSRVALLEAEKISVWQSMAQQLAHEVKNPLTPIKLSAERVLRRWQNEPGNIGSILENSMLAIIQETDGLSTMLNDFRTLSRPMEPSQSWTNLKTAVDDVIGFYTTAYLNVNFVFDSVDPVIYVKIDPNRLSQILTNLIVNSIDAMENTGTIDIKADLVKKGEISYCRLSVRDTGKGINKDDAQLVFTPYFTTKESGTGLGLPIIERIVSDNGGSIWFNSAEGVGTTFFIDLPAEKRATD